MVCEVGDLLTVSVASGTSKTCSWERKLSLSTSTAFQLYPPSHRPSKRSQEHINQSLTSKLPAELKHAYIIANMQTELLFKQHKAWR